MSKRVHELAKELDVQSKAILAKCRAEGVDVKNHMSTVSVGLEMTIREWFSEGEAETAEEHTEKVDLEKVKRKRRKKKAEADTAAAGEGDTATAVEEPPDEAEAEPEAPAPDDEEQTEQDSEEEKKAGKARKSGPAAAEQPAEPEPEAEPAEESEPEQDEAETEAPEQAPDVAAETAVPEAEEGGAKPAPPPQNVPKPAALKGPKVIRVERPEPDAMRTPRSRGPRPRPAAGPAEAPPDPGAPSRSPRRRGGGSEPAAGEETDAKGKKRRGRSPRRSARSEAIERVREWRDQDLIERQERLAQATGRLKNRRSASGQRQLMTERPSEATVEAPVSVKDLSSAIAVKGNDIIRFLMQQGTMATVNQVLDEETAVLVANNFGVELKVEAEAPPEEQLKEEFEAIERKNLQPRPPVVTFLGHVDHGKTSLLDRIRHEDVVSTEAGGITQHIGSYRYTRDKLDVVFLDTPGHEAFTHLRSRGANMTDVVVLVVAADDGVMPQTIEAINHAKAAGVPIVVAMNKIDRPNANPDRVLGQLAEHDLTPQEWGGNIEVIRTSATEGEGVDELIELLSLEAEMLELKADPTIPATGTVIEGEMAENRGVLARCLVQEGTLKIGDVVVCGQAAGRVRALTDDKGRSIKEAGPATPVEISGLDEVPGPGEKFYVVDDLKRAKELAETRAVELRENELNRRQAVTLENFYDRISAGETQELPLVVKADVQGSIEVLEEQLSALSTDEVKVNLLHAAVGGINESDVLLAAASDAIIIGFHVAADDRAKSSADGRGVQIRLFKVIYEITDSVRKALEGMLEPEIREKTMGQCEIRETFKVSRLGTIAGCYVTDGVIQRNNKIRLIRDGIVVQDELKLDSLKRFKDDAREVRAGLECGIKLAGYDDLKEGDVLEAWTTEEVARTL